MATPAPRRTRRLGHLAVAAVMGLGIVGALAPTAFAQETNDNSETPQLSEEGRPGRPNLTDEQQACLEQQGIVKPEPDENGERPHPTDEQREAFRAAAEACDIELPQHGNRPELTDEQKACLEDQGIVKPEPDANGERPRPTDEQREAFRAAAEACGIDLPDRPQSDSQSNEQSDTESESDTSNAS